MCRCCPHAFAGVIPYHRSDAVDRTHSEADLTASAIMVAPCTCSTCLVPYQEYIAGARVCVSKGLSTTDFTSCPLTGWTQLSGAGACATVPALHAAPYQPAALPPTADTARHLLAASHGTCAVRHQRHGNVLAHAAAD